MKRLILAGVLGVASALSACDEPASRDESMMEAGPPVEMAPAAEDVAVPAAAPSAVDTPPADPSALPSSPATSEETVQPESETLFY
jgi:hypothetical protein